MLESFKKELDKRKTEKQEAEAAIKREKERLAEKRANVEKNIIRKKVKVVDKLTTAHEERRDEKHMAEFRAEQTRKVEQARIERRNQAVNKHKGKLITGGVVAAVLVIAACLIGGHIQNQQVMDDYNAAVDYILEGDYSDAKNTLGEISTDDAENVEEAGDVDALTKYAEAQLTIDDCAGHPSTFRNTLKNVGEIENSEVNQQYEEAMTQTKAAEKVQGKINTLDFTEITPDSKDELAEISTKMSQIDDRYEVLVDDSKLEDAEGMITHMEKEDAPGKVMLAISEIDKVTLDSKSTLKGIRESYDELTESNQKEVLNYELLTSAESKLKSLQKAKKEKERKEAEEKAEKERLAAEKAEREAEEARERSMSSDVTVYWVPNGTVYHSRESCPTLSRSKTILNGSLSSCPMSEPCKVCH